MPFPSKSYQVLYFASSSSSPVFSFRRTTTTHGHHVSTHYERPTPTSILQERRRGLECWNYRTPRSTFKLKPHLFFQQYYTISTSDWLYVFSWVFWECLEKIWEFMDQEVCMVFTCGTGGVALYYLYECDDYGTCESELGFAYHSDVFLVSTRLTDGQLFSWRVEVLMWGYRYFSLFVIYTPYTIYQCRFLFFFFFWCRGFVTDFENFLDGWKGWANLIFRDGWKCKCFMSSQSTIASTHLFRRYHPGSMWCRRKLLGRKGELSHLIQFIVEKLWQLDFFLKTRHTNTRLSFLVCFWMHGRFRFVLRSVGY